MDNFITETFYLCFNMLTLVLASVLYYGGTDTTWGTDTTYGINDLISDSSPTG